MQRFRAWRIIAALAAAICCGVPPAIAQEAAPIKADLAASTTWWGQIPLMVAIDKGWFKAAGLDVTLRAIVSSSDRMAAVASGSAAFSNLGRIAVIANMARGDKSFWYFANIDDSPGNEGCWARPGFTSFQQLRGHKVAANTSAEITMNGLLQNAGMTEKDVQFVNLPPDQMAPAIARGDVDAACVWQPLLAGVEKAAPGGKLLGLDSDTPIGQKFHTMASPDIVIISRKFVAEHPDAAGKLAAAMFKGADYANSNPEDTAKTVAHYFHKSPEDVLAAMKTFKYFGGADWQQHMQVQTEQMQYLAQWLHDNGKIPSLPEVKAWENVSFVPKQ
ncbi:MAG TPA: ABC transporter substrate-binding protein [Acetobacteraceae bacterium]|nr:ABC transporter substrate-binding protein [Acetobacteraceae bacterium]